MNKLRLAPCSVKDIAQARESSPLMHSIVSRLIKGGISAMIEDEDGTRVAAFGLYEEEALNGVFSVWLLPTPRFGALVRAPLLVRRALNEAIEELRPRRVQTTVEDRPELKRWIEWLGFAYEGRMRHAAPDGKDLLLYGRVGPWE